MPHKKQRQVKIVAILDLTLPPIYWLANEHHHDILNKAYIYCELTDHEAGHGSPDSSELKDVSLYGNRRS